MGRATAVDEGSQHDARCLLEDDELVARARSGDNGAFDELYRRHSSSARRTARWMTHSEHAAEDIVADVFASMLSALRNGRGPHDNFTAYLRASVRNRCIAHRRAAVRSTPTDDDEFDARPSEGSTSDTSATSQLVATAFAALTPRWQRALWMAEVEGRPAKDIAAELNLPVAAVPALSYRARRAFAEAYLQQHAEHASDASCRAVADKLPRYVRGSASRRDMLKVDVHLESCGQCKRTVGEMSDLNMSLRSLPAPPMAALAVGVGTVATWLATAAAIGALVVVPVVALQGDQSANTSNSDGTTITVPGEVDPVLAVPGKVGTVPGQPGSDRDDPAASTTAGQPGALVAPSTDSTDLVPDGSTDASVPTLGTADGPPLQVPLTDAGTATTVAAALPGTSLTLPNPSAAATTTIPPITAGQGTGSTGGTLPPLLPAIELPVDVPLPLVPIDANVTANGSGVGVDLGVGLPAGLGSLGADVAVGGGGVQATVVLPTLPLLGTLPPLVVDIPLPQPVADLLDNLLGGLLGPP